MKKKNTKTQNKKLSVAGILGLVLLGLVLVGVVANVIKDNPFSKDSNNPTVVIEQSDWTEEFTIEYEEGMTWAEGVDSEYNTFKFVIQEDNTITKEVVVDGEEPHILVITIDGDYENVVLGTESIDPGNYVLYEY